MPTTATNNTATIQLLLAYSLLSTISFFYAPVVGGVLPSATICQPICSFARSGTTLLLPNVYAAGTVHGCLCSVTLPVLRGKP
jgi:hypothetical protein